MLKQIAASLIVAGITGVVMLCFTAPSTYMAVVGYIAVSITIVAGLIFVFCFGAEVHDKASYIFGGKPPMTLFAYVFLAWIAVIFSLALLCFPAKKLESMNTPKATPMPKESSVTP